MGYGRLWQDEKHPGDTGNVTLWHVESHKEAPQLDGGAGDAVKAVAMSENGQFMVAGRRDGHVEMWGVPSGRPLWRFPPPYSKKPNDEPDVTSMAISPDGKLVVTGGGDGTIRRFNSVDHPLQPQIVRGHTSEVTSVALSKDMRLVASGSTDQTTRLWNAQSGEELIQLISARDGTWAAVASDGRFDTSNIEGMKGLHWIMPDDRMRPLGLEIFMRDYYEPRLLSRLLSCSRAGQLDPHACETQFKPIRPLAELNRVQPEVKILGVRRGSSAHEVLVEVQALGQEDKSQPNGKTKTAAYDLRLFRNGQLVGQWPEAGELTFKSLDTTSEEGLKAWQNATLISLDQKGKATKTFTVRLPRREDLKEVAFTAYAFNSDRVKSLTTAPFEYALPAGNGKSAVHRAYLITIGVNANQSHNLDLELAVSSAERVRTLLSNKLKAEYGKPIEIRLYSEFDDNHRLKLNAANKADLKAILDLLAGRQVSLSLRDEVDPEHLQADGIGGKAKFVCRSFFHCRLLLRPSE